PLAQVAADEARAPRHQCSPFRVHRSSSRTAHAFLIESLARSVARDTETSSSTANGEGAPARTASITVFTASDCPLSGFTGFTLLPPGRRVSRKFSHAAVRPSAETSNLSFGRSALALAR